MNRPSVPTLQAIADQDSLAEWLTADVEDGVVGCVGMDYDGMPFSASVLVLDDDTRGGDLTIRYPGTREPGRALEFPVWVITWDLA